MSKSRRDFLRYGAASLGAVVAGGCAPTPSFIDEDDRLWRPDGLSGPRPAPFLDTGVWSDTAATAPSCATTTPFFEGPYYRPNAPSRWDLRTLGEAGTLLTISGTVRSALDCALLPGAILEIWHVKQDGTYDMTTSTMHYRAKVEIGFEGCYTFTTVKPIPYPVENNRMMPAHFHFRLNAAGHTELVTQLRFLNDPYDDGTCPTSLMMSPTVNSDGSEDTVFDFALDVGN
ncbi:MAG: hypothetical protein H6739_22170 [Alphaproteobacteria bacterium]|nr:hypothetical protein [Alphaproteobacteria bacterium]